MRSDSLKKKEKPSKALSLQGFGGDYGTRTCDLMRVNEDLFLYGFRLGARMILDIIGDYEGQFCSPDEAG